MDIKKFLRRLSPVRLLLKTTIDSEFREQIAESKRYAEFKHGKITELSDEDSKAWMETFQQKLKEQNNFNKGVKNNGNFIQYDDSS